MARRAAALAALALLAACGDRPRPAPTPAPAVCRVGPDGGPVADRIAEKGIGGTGAPLLADKGIGGTGIIAVISGFASICLAGQEVALPPEAPILLGTEPASARQLRAGQVAVIDAGDTGAGLAARRVTIRFEASGPVGQVDGDRLVVAGQGVAVTAGTLGQIPAMGDWVAVSGVRRADGVIEATRLERRSPGPVVVHGVLRRDGGAFHVGTLVLARAPGMDALLGQSVVVTGRLLLTELVVDQIAPDLLASDPAAFFGPAVGVVLIEGYAELGGGRLRLGQGFAAPVAGPVAAGSQRGIYRFERGAAGLRAVDADRGSIGAREGFAPAPVPNRSSRDVRERSGRFGPGAGGGRLGGERGGDGRPGPDQPGGDRAGGGPRSPAGGRGPG